MLRRIGRAKAGLAADYAAQLARNVGKVVFFASHIDVMDIAEDTFAERGLSTPRSAATRRSKAREKAIDAFVNDPDVTVIVCSLAAAGVGINLQVASNVVLAELSWTDAEQTQAIDRVHRIGQTEPVTAWRIIAAQTIDTRIAELIDSKAGLAARALDGSDEEVSSPPTSSSRRWSRCSPTRSASASPVAAAGAPPDADPGLVPAHPGLISGRILRWGLGGAAYAGSHVLDYLAGHRSGCRWIRVPGSDRRQADRAATQPHRAADRAEGQAPSLTDQP